MGVALGSLLTVLQRPRSLTVTTSQNGNYTRALSWVAVKELKLSYHNMDIW